MSVVTQAHREKSGLEPEIRLHAWHCPAHDPCVCQCVYKDLKSMGMMLKHLPNSSFWQEEMSMGHVHTRKGATEKGRKEWFWKSIEASAQTLSGCVALGR